MNRPSPTSRSSRLLSLRTSAVLAAATSLAACNAASSTTVGIGTLQTAVRTAGQALTAAGVAEAGDSPALPHIDGMKITLVNSIGVCSGTFLARACASQPLLSFAAPVEVELSPDAASLVDLGALGTPGAATAGSYSHAFIGVGNAYAIKAYFHVGGDTVYTTTAGLALHTGSAAPGDDYDYLPQDDLYPGLDGEEQQETTFFAAPFELTDGAPVAMQVLFDVRRAGRFDGSDTSAHFVPTYPNLYATFNDVGVASVETYALGADEAGANADTAAAMSLLFAADGTLLAGRTRYFDDLVVQPAGKMEQFVKDFSCAADGTCSFAVGDYGRDEFLQSVSGFVRKQVGEAGTFDLTTPTGTSTLHDVRVAE